jgi:hypothetical protein
VSSGRKSQSREKKAASKAATAAKVPKPKTAYQLAKTAIAPFELQPADKTLVASLVEYVRTVDAGLTKNALYNETLIAIAVYFLRHVAPEKYRHMKIESLDAVQLHGYIRLALLHFCSTDDAASITFRHSISIPPEVAPTKKRVAFREGSGHFCVAEYSKFYVILQQGEESEEGIPLSEVDSHANAFADYFLGRFGLSEQIYEANTLQLSYADFRGLENTVQEATPQVLPGYKEVPLKVLSLPPAPFATGAVPVYCCSVGCGVLIPENESESAECFLCNGESTAKMFCTNHFTLHEHCTDCIKMSIDDIGKIIKLKPLPDRSSSSQSSSSLPQQSLLGFLRQDGIVKITGFIPAVALHVVVECDTEIDVAIAPAQSEKRIDLRKFSVYDCDDRVCIIPSRELSGDEDGHGKAPDIAASEDMIDSDDEVDEDVLFDLKKPKISATTKKRIKLLDTFSLNFYVINTVKSTEDTSIGLRQFSIFLRQTVKTPDAMKPFAKDIKGFLKRLMRWRPDYPFLTQGLL